MFYIENLLRRAPNAGATIPSLENLKEWHSRCRKTGRGLSRHCVKLGSATATLILTIWAWEAAAQAQCKSYSWNAPVQICSSITEGAPAPWLDKQGLLPPCHNPAAVPRADEPGSTDPTKLVPAVPMSAQTCTATRLFDAAESSQRNYDLVNCLDGLTFGFGNWPQAELGPFFTALAKDPAAEKAMAERLAEAFKTNPDAWAAFKKNSRIESAQPDTQTMRLAIHWLSSIKLKNVRGLRNKSVLDGTCAQQPKPGTTSFYFDNAKWLVPTMSYSLRDPAMVAMQVHYWEGDVLKPGAQDASILGLPNEGVFLMAFYESNPGLVPAIGSALKRRKAPETLKAGGRDWRWDGSDRPRALNKVTIDQWHTLLVWQAMCPERAPGKTFRIRDRNLKFFEVFLAKDFTLPKEKRRGQPEDKSRENCDPGMVVPRSS
jgi:hypothetical protein